MKYPSFLFLLSFLIFTSCEKNSTEEILWWHDADVVELDASDFELNIADTSSGRTSFIICVFYFLLISLVLF